MSADQRVPLRAGPVGRAGQKGWHGVAAARFEIYIVSRRDAAGVEPATESVTWRLLSNNNRDLGRAATVFPDIDSCAAAVEYLRGVGERAASISVRDGRADWTWRVQVDQVPVAVSSRRYHRRVQAEYACAVFLGLVPNAEVMNAVRFVQL
jgi:hypothetical protein